FGTDAESNSRLTAAPKTLKPPTVSKTYPPTGLNDPPEKNVSFAFSVAERIPMWAVPETSDVHLDVISPTDEVKR
ncbi:hypothetical protein ACPV51_27965, partial [Vibrio astriarenae]